MWQLKRYDDNGNEFVIAIYPTRQQAEQAQHEYERRQHKQIYWVEKVR